MTIDEFFTELEQLCVRWHLTGFKNMCIRSFDGGMPSQQYSPIELLCYYKGGTISWQPGRLYKPSLLEYHFQHGQILGLSEKDHQSLFRMSDNDWIPQNGPCNNLDLYVRNRLLQVCHLDLCSKCGVKLAEPAKGCNCGNQIPQGSNGK
jgi:hypothetical protein